MLKLTDDPGLLIRIGDSGQGKNYRSDSSPFVSVHVEPLLHSHHPASAIRPQQLIMRRNSVARDLESHLRQAQQLFNAWSHARGIDSSHDTSACNRLFTVRMVESHESCLTSMPMPPITHLAHSPQHE